MIFKQGVTRKSGPQISTKDEQLFAGKDGVSPKPADSLLLTFPLPFASSSPESCTQGKKQQEDAQRQFKAQHQHTNGHIK